MREVCARGINTTWENLQIEKHKSVRWAERTPSWFVLFDLQIFSGGVYPPSATSRTISFSISNRFGINLIHFCDEKDGAAGNSIVLFRCFDPLSRHLTEAKRRTRTVSKSATFWQRKVWTQRPSRGEKLRCRFLARKSAKLSANTKVRIFGKERCKIHRQFQRY